jgi:alkanesulfonate monooxygenase SsuD/methylene tetrahydromethanopterin reductase-like flavin-dependent oxidoreductase (luciferase family)
MRGTSFDMGLMFSFRNPEAWRRPFPDVYRDELALIEYAEELGFDTIWLTEHHFADDGYSPSILTLAAAIAARTSRVRIGFNLLLLPLHDAVAVAEDIATLDVLSNGRIDVGLGQGYARHEFAGFGIDLADRLGRFREGIDVLNGLWTNDTFSYSGKHYNVDSARLMPKPVQQPAPPLWIGATSIPGVRRAGRLGANLLGLTNRRLQAEYEQARSEAGFDTETAKVLQLHWTYVADTDEQAWDHAAPHFQHLLSVYAGWLSTADDENNKVQHVKVPTVDELKAAKTAFIQPVFGSPATVADALRASAAAVRTTHLAFGVLPGMDPALTRRHLERIATDVCTRIGGDPPTA